MMRKLGPWLAGIVLSVPLVALRYPPMPDLAMHEATVAVMRRLHDPSFVPPRMYFVVAPQANQLFHFLAYALATLVATDTACKLVVAVTCLLTVVAMARLLARAGRSPALAPLVSFVVLGWCFRWGLVANLLGFALLLFALPSLLDLVESPTRRRLLVCAGASVLLVFAHVTSALAFAGVAVALTVFGGKESLRRPAALLPAALVLLLAGAQTMSARFAPQLLGAAMARTGSDYGLEPLDRLMILPGAVFGGAATANLSIESLFCLLLLAAAVWTRSREATDALEAVDAVDVIEAPRRGSTGAGDSVVRRHRFALLSLGFLGVYLLFPMTLGGSTLLAHRFLPPAFAFLLVACSPRDGSPERLPAGSPAASPAGSRISGWIGAVALLAPLVVVALLWPTFLAADRRARDLDVVLSALPDDTSVAQLDLTPRPPGHVAPVPGLAARAQAVHGGRMLFAFIDQPPYPLYIRPDLRWNEPVERLATMPFAFLPSVDGHRFAYLLVLETDPRAESLLPDALTPEYEPVRAQGQWQLFRSTLAVDPVASPDRPLTEPPLDTLARRMNRLARSQGGGGG